VLAEVGGDAAAGSGTWCVELVLEGLVSGSVAGAFGGTTLGGGG
jgi:hypothetical protein